MNKLEEYYKAQTASDSRKMPKFSDLSDDEKAEFENSLGFALWRDGRAISELSDAIKRFVGKG